MGLIFSGVTAIHLEGGISLQATDSETGDRVKVRASQEAMKDYGASRVHTVASEKYDQDILEDGWVWVRAHDCA